MVFFVNVASDLYGRKQNTRMEFPCCPTVAELINAAESQLDATARSGRPAGYPDVPFRVQTFQVYDDVLLRWVDLYSSSQLTSGCQVYAFQPETVWTVDLQGTIPVARDSVTWSSPVGSPRRARIATDHGVPPSMSEKLRAAFYDLDQGNKGYVLYTDLRAAFLRYDMEFSYATIGELFTEADRNRDGHVSYEEWVRFSIDHPNIVDALFFRARDLQQESQLGQSALGLSTAATPQRQIADHSALSASRSMTRASPYAAAPVPTAAEIIAEQRRAREAELDRLYRESQLSAERARSQRDYDDAKREADIARARAQAATERERAALDKLYFAPSSPQRSF